MGEAQRQAERFELRDQIGAGSMGRVYRVFDRLRGGEVALKALRAIGPTALYRFKREFRELCDLCHPNLVAFHELYVVEGEWMFTMELVEGMPFRAWVDRSEARLRDALIQLADGLTALHAAGKIHRDVKPSNVLVAADGRVVILDFGLVRDPEGTDVTHEGRAIGTPAYMSPEQAADLPLTPATDWYSVGVMLYEALTARKPYVGSSGEVLLDKQRFDPPPPSATDPDVAADLDVLAMALLARDPAMRPRGEEVLARLGAAPSPWTRRIVDRASPRDLTQTRATELAQLRDALDASRDHPVILMLRGKRGAGRSTLLDTFADQLGSDATTFQVRVGRREDVPFRGLDQLVDCLTRYLIAADPEVAAELLPRDLDGLAQMFPTMQRLRAARLPEIAPAGDPKQLARRAFGAVAEMLTGIARRGPLAVLLDDAHWGEIAGAQTTVAMMSRPDAPRMLFVASYDTEHAAAVPITMLEAWTGDLRRIDLSER